MTLKESIEYAANNPNSNFASELQRRILNGDYDQTAKREGVDLASQRQSGFLGSIVKSTVGSEGLTGFAKEVGKTAALPATISGIKDVEQAFQASGQAAKGADVLIAEATKQTDPKRKKELLARANAILKGTVQASDMAKESLGELTLATPSATKVAGTALNTGALLSAGFAPTTFASKMLLSTGIGAATGAGQELQKEGATAKSVLGRAATGALVGGATQGVMSGVSKLASLATKELPRTLLVKKLGFTPKQLQQGADRNIAKFILDNKKIGSIKGLAADAERVIASADSKIDDLLASGSYNKGNVFDVRKLAEATAARLNKAGGTMTADDILNSVADHIGKGQGSQYLSREMNNVLGINNLRKGIDFATKPSDFLRTKNPLDTTMALEFANTLRNAVKSSAKGTAPLFDEMAKNINFRNALEVAASKSQQIGGFRDILSALLGTTFGTLAGNPMLGFAAGVSTERALTSMPVQTATAVGLNELSRLAPFMAKLTPAMRLFLINSLTPESEGNK